MHFCQIAFHTLRYGSVGGISSVKKLIHTHSGPALPLARATRRAPRTQQSGGAISDFFLVSMSRMFKSFKVTCNGVVNIKACVGGIYVAKLRCRHTADSRTPLATVLKLVCRLEASQILCHLSVFHIAFLCFHHCLSFHQASKNKLATKHAKLHSPAASLELR